MTQRDMVKAVSYIVFLVVASIPVSFVGMKALNLISS